MDFKSTFYPSDSINAFVDIADIIIIKNTHFDAEFIVAGIWSRRFGWWFIE